MEYSEITDVLKSGDPYERIDLETSLLPQIVVSP